MKVAVTGVNGFVGEHVVNSFVNDGYEVIGIGHDTQAGDKVADRLSSYVSCNLLDASSVDSIDLTGVDTLIHLAGLSNVSDSFDKPLPYITDNVVMTYNLLEHAQKHMPTVRVLVISSGALYNPHQELPLIEDSRLLENSPYAVGKLSVEHVTNYFRLRDLDAVVVRPFNHIGPGQAEGFLIPDLYKQLQSSAERGDETISVGNIATKRDYTDVRDIAAAYKLLSQAKSLKYGVYNVCTGRSLSGSEILSILQSEMGVEHVTPVVDSSKVRPTDIMDIYGDASRIEAETGWKPIIPIDQTIREFIASQ